jgi:hypothetical protein
MQMNKLVFGALILGCLGAAGVGGYLANRQRPRRQAPPRASRRRQPSP